MSSKRAAEDFSFGLLKFILLAVSKGISTPLSVAKEIRRLHGNTNTTESSVRKRLDYAYRQGYVQRFGSIHVPHYQIATKGEQHLARLTFDELTLNSKSEWDGKWRIVMFDIPEENRAARDLIRRLVKQLGMRRLQNSVWLTPLPCKAQFDQIRMAYGIRDHILLVETRDLENANMFRKHWDL